MSIPNNLTGRSAEVARATKHAATELDTHSKATRDLRRTMSRVPPDELSQTDLLAMRAGMLRNLETHENLTASLVKLLNKITDSLDGNNDP